MTQPCVLTYHSLDESGSVISVRPDTFRAQIDFLVRRRIPVVPLSELNGTPGGVGVTFDDGFENFYEHAFPILSAYRLPATVFIISGYCGRNNDWPTQPKSGIPRLALMNWAQVKEIADAGIELGAHTVTHPRLSALPAAQIQQELDRCRNEIEQRTGKLVRTMAYPYGDSNALVRECARERFALSYGTRFAPMSASSDVTDLPRLDMFYFRSQFWFESLWSWQGTLYVKARKGLREIRQALA
jgi:peptidoglycan/xylan/chitin deacetylase (PgdA/CDA1 family)